LLSDTPTPRIYLDANVLFSAAFSSTGGARMLFRLAESQSIQLLVCSSVLTEAETALRRKAPAALGHLALLLDLSRCQVVDDAPRSDIEAWSEFLPYLPDAAVIAAAVASQADYLVTLDRQHILDNKRLMRAFPLPIGTPGDCLAWLRTNLQPPNVDYSPTWPSHQLNERPGSTTYRTKENP
jgi:predicted nucleic acid-binding protein